MEVGSAVNATQDELRLLPLPGDGPDNLGVGANAPVLPTLLFEGVNFPEDPIKLLSVQVTRNETHIFIFVLNRNLVPSSVL